jgi:UDP-N-acetylmuramate dehydrogenase
MKTQKEFLISKNLEKIIQKQVSLSSLTSWQIGGPADFLCEPHNLEELKSCYQWAQEESLSVTVLGGGSNVLVSDQGVDGLVILMRKYSQIHISENLKTQRLVIEADSGVKKSEILKTFLKYRLDPALFLAGLPGDLGGGIVMNAGVSEALVPREFCELVDWIEVLKPDLRTVRYQNQDLEWNYRKSSGWQPGLITRVQLSWPLKSFVDSDSILAQVKAANHKRLSQQPLDLPSCGSVFKNPSGQKAAWLIDRAGLKGYTLGQAQVSLKHANFIVNLGQAKACDVWSLIEFVRNEVKLKFGVDLESEVIRLGRWSV